MAKHEEQKIKEEQIQKDIVEWCKRHNVLVYHIENEREFDPSDDKKWQKIKHRKEQGVLAGVSDLHFPDLLMYFELKTLTGKLSEKQKDFIDKVKINHDVFLVRDTFNGVTIIKKRIELFAKNEMNKQIRLMLDNINTIC